MKNIRWIFCVLLLVSLGCSRDFAGSRVPVWPDFNHVPVLYGRTVVARYVAEGYYGSQQDIGLVAPIIENGLRRRGAIIVVDRGVWSLGQENRFRHDFEALVTVRRFNGKTSVFGNYYSYNFIAAVDIKIIDHFGRVIAASYGERGFNTDIQHGDEGCSICSGTWIGSFKMAAKLASLTLSER